jgi:hypothetical protein
MKLPKRDHTKLDTEQGLFHKFEVTRTDGSSEPGGKHQDCAYFVLDVDHDPCAKAALAAYADAVEATHPLLAADMRTIYDLPQAMTAVRGPREKLEEALRALIPTGEPDRYESPALTRARALLEGKP